MMKKMIVLLSMLTLLLALSACNQDIPVGTDPLASSTDPTTIYTPSVECQVHKFAGDSLACSVCGIDYFSATLEFTLSDTRDSYIVSDIGQCEATTIIIPATYQGLPVTRIGKEAFAAFIGHDYTKPRVTCYNITAVTLPASLKRIDDFAFLSCTALKKIVIPEGVTYIGMGAFSSCHSLTEIVIPEGVTDIGQAAFSHCESLKALNLPESIVSVGEAMISNCESLESLALPEGITVIPKKFASFCLSLKSVKLGSAVTRIEENAFSRCSVLEEIALGSALEHIEDKAFFQCKSLKSISLPGTLKHIGGSAFGLCALETIELPDSLESAGGDNGTVFSKCEQLQYNEYKGMGYLGNKKNPYLMLVCRLDPTVTDVETHEDTRIIEPTVVRHEDVKSLHLGASVKQIPMQGIWHKRQYVGPLEITLSPENKTFHMSGNCLIETASKTLLLGFKDAVIPDDGSVTVIGRAAFAHTEGITGLIVPECVEEIGINAFYQCKDLEYLLIGSNVKTLGHDVLYQKEAICEVYYHGTAEQWETLKESTNGFYLNNFFASRPRYYYSEESPTREGNFWHYVDGKPTPWPVLLPTTEE